ncbi:hypothetical protein FQU76_28440 [Streptomyces qinzhouensis]|uniref:Uncharacterized protein n=1 Tax=Streptomyces qinzhouensis TaxID=2599401 RepID=A0A5B8JHK1_9ACTN|nr:hypothetical protein FQU76_28440 [Streptomyces qinzhouensis]
MSVVTAEGIAFGKPVRFKLGSHSSTSRRLALRWLRNQAHRLADGLDPDPNAPWLRTVPGALVRLPSLRADVPTELRRWCRDDQAYEDALSALTTRVPVMLSVADLWGSYTLAVWPMSDSAARTEQCAEPHPEPSTARASP